MRICICSHSPALASPPQLHLRSSGIRFSSGAYNLDPSHAQFTVGFTLLWESNATADLTGGRAQEVTRAVGSSCKYRGSFTRSPTIHLLLCSPVPNRTSIGPWPKGWGRLVYLIIANLIGAKWYSIVSLIGIYPAVVSCLSNTWGKAQGACHRELAVAAAAARSNKDDFGPSKAFPNLCECIWLAKSHLPLETQPRASLGVLFSLCRFSTPPHWRTVE